MIILRQKEFGGRSVYEGVSDEKSLRRIRNKIASKIKGKRRLIDLVYDQNVHTAVENEEKRQGFIPLSGSVEFNMDLAREKRKKKNRIADLLNVASEFNKKTSQASNINKRDIRREFKERTKDLFKTKTK